MADLNDLRAKTAQVLDEGLKAGLLSTEEHSWRVGHLERADSVDALEALVSDLWGSDEPPRAVAPVQASQVSIMASRSFVLADLGQRSEVVTVLGSSRINLRGLTPGESLNLDLVILLGDAVIEVPEGVAVRVQTNPILGDCHVDRGLPTEGAQLRISGVVLLGSLRVVRVKSAR